MKSLVLVAISLLMFGCGGVRHYSATPETMPNTSKILHVSSRFGVASACPVGPRTVVTAAHVIDPNPFDPKAPYLSVRWQQGTRSGYAGNATQGSRFARDLAIIEPDPDVEFYPIAPEAPKVGAKVWISGWDWRDRDRAFKTRIWESKVTHSVAGLLIIDPNTEPGSSGSCILDDQGRVVAILHWKWPVGEGMSVEHVGVGVLVAGESF